MSNTRRCCTGTLWTILLTGYICLSNGRAEPLPPSETLVYEVRYGSLLAGRLTRTLHVDGSHYALHSELEPAGVASWIGDDRLVEHSQGRLVEGVSEPREYRFDDDRKDRHYRYIFDPQLSLVQDNHPDPDIPMHAGLQDEVSVLQALRHALLHGATNFGAAVVNGAKGRAYQHHYEVAGSETVTVPAGEYAVLRVTRVTSRGKYRMTFWCAESLDFAPVRISRVDPKGREVTMHLAARNPPETR